MSRAERLLQLMQFLRCHRFPVSGASLATEMGVSLRTLYRDIASLQAQGALIDGEVGVGYVLRPGFMLPPLMFSEEEIEALVLGSRWVADRADARLGEAARNAVAKISAVLPADLRHELETNALFVGPTEPFIGSDLELTDIRHAIRAELKLEIVYRDPKGAETARTIWPFALAFFDRVRVVVAWCELRQDTRHFRADRIVGFTVSKTRYPKRRQTLLKEWRDTHDIPEQ